MSASQFREHIDQLRGKLGQIVELEDDDETNKSCISEGKALSENSNPNKEVKQVIVDEENESGLVTWKDFMEFFSYSFGGAWGMILIFLLHAMINGCTMAVSLYLAFSLTH